MDNVTIHTDRKQFAIVWLDNDRLTNTKLNSIRHIKVEAFQNTPTCKWKIVIRESHFINNISVTIIHTLSDMDVSRVMEVTQPTKPDKRGRVCVIDTHRLTASRKEETETIDNLITNGFGLSRPKGKGIRWYVNELMKLNAKPL